MVLFLRSNIETTIMDNKKHKTDEQSQTSQTTSPVNLRSGDKLRENPANDEETISQNSKKSDEQQTQQSSLTREHHEERNQVTNEDEQKEIVNPTEGDWNNKNADNKS